MTRTEIPVSAQAWIACALLTQEHPEREAFSEEEILHRVRLAHLSRPSQEIQKGTVQHIRQHAVANRRTDARFRYLYAPKARTGKRRLFRPGDDFLPSKKRGATHPSRDDIPKEFWPLLSWYESWSKGEGIVSTRLKPLFLDFSEDELLLLHRAATRRGMAVEQAVRRATLDWAKSLERSDRETLLDLVGTVEGAHDTSDAHDDIYGAP
ncbi:MAG: hypothetical protein LC623_01725 [Halobacteriales archaeon]|nr:hypothetical protein [Halobacteriales archaeon]